MTQASFRFAVLCGLLLTAACGADDEYLPVPSAARGGVAPPATIAEPMRRASAPSVAMTAPAPMPVQAAPAVPVPPPVAPAAPVIPPVAVAAPQPAPLPPAPAPTIPNKRTALAVLRDEPVAPAPAAAPVPAVTAVPVFASVAPSPAGGYVLGIGDDIRLTVYGEDDLSGQYEIGSTGIVALPLIGNVQAAGLTIGQFEGAVAEKLSHGYLKDPRVSAQVATYRPFFILGEVAKPGSYPYINGMTVLSAVAVAGGYTYRADTGDIRVTHANIANKKEQDVDQTDPVMPGDIIRVTERFF